MLTRVLVIYNTLLTLLLIWLLFRVFALEKKQTEQEQGPSFPTNSQSPTNPHAPAFNGKIAFVNIDTLNEKSLFVLDMVKKLKAARLNIESSLESLQQQYQQKVKEYQNSASAGIAPESELAAKAKEIQAIEREAQNKQIQMDHLAMELNEKNELFQRQVKEMIQKEFGSRYDYIFSYSDAIPSLLYGNPAADITKEAVALINAGYQEKKNKSEKK